MLERGVWVNESSVQPDNNYGRVRTGYPLTPIDHVSMQSMFRMVGSSVTRPFLEFSMLLKNNYLSKKAEKPPAQEANTSVLVIL
jgi:hypothetical protein